MCIHNDDFCRVRCENERVYESDTARKRGMSDSCSINPFLPSLSSHPSTLPSPLVSRKPLCRSRLAFSSPSPRAEQKQTETEEHSATQSFLDDTMLVFPRFRSLSLNLYSSHTLATNAIDQF